MSTAPVPVPRASGAPRRMRLAWAQARAMWASVAIVAMWLTVLFIGLFGGDITSSTPGGTSSSVPVTVPVALFALIATWVVARYGFAASREVDDLREEVARLRDELARR